MKSNIHQYWFIAFCFLLWISNTHNAHALSTIAQIQINKPIQQGYQFDVKRRNDRNPQQYAFSVDITLKQITFPHRYNTFLGLIHLEKMSATIKRLRKVPCKAQVNHVLCDFTVPKQALANPELGFIFEVPVFVEMNGTFRAMPSTDFRFFRLKDVPGQ